MMEPDQNMSYIEQEERRRLFWSVYLLDRFVSCSKQRPQSMVDEDCQVRLPCREQTFRDGIKETTDTLLNIISAKNLRQQRPGDFALVVLMASALGRCARYALDNPRASNHIAPWNPSSEYTIVHSTLTHLEIISGIEGTTFKEVIERHFVFNGKIDQQQVGHFILQQALFHLSHCLLHHPFLLRQRLETIPTRAPLSWLSHAWALCRDHAISLSSLLADAKDLGCIVSTSFYGYCALIAGTVHALYRNSNDLSTKSEALKHLTFDVKYLEDVSNYWKNTKLIVCIFLLKKTAT